MHHPRMRGTIVVVVLVGVACGAPSRPAPVTDVKAPPPDRPQPEEPVARIETPRLDFVKPLDVDLPAMPSFGFPAVDPGFHSVKELRVAGRALLDTEIKVKGYITWIYDCVVDIGKPGQTRKQIQRLIDEDPTRCQRKKLTLGDKRDTPPEVSLWVVDVPRPPNKLEKERLPKAEIAAWPKVPKMKVGDHVTITGTFALRSPHSETNSDGLLVYAKLEPAKPGAPRLPPREVKAPAIVAKTPQPRRDAPAVDRATQNASVDKTKACAAAFGEKLLADAIAACTEAASMWEGNHQAWYVLGAARAASGDWRDAVAAFGRAADLEPRDPTYQMWHGIALYEAGDRDDALATLLLAVELEPRLSRPHHYLGRIYRDIDRWVDAAKAFETAIRADPRQPEPYVALAELYRRWDETDAAIGVATAGTQNIAGAREGALAWHVLGMALFDKRVDDKAIEAFSAALTNRPDLHPSMFMRGQAYHRKGDSEKARRDLEAFVGSPLPDNLARQQANRILLEITGSP
jgi:tetratricopeptide (TPR) repeat protein